MRRIYTHEYPPKGFAIIYYVKYIATGQGYVGATKVSVLDRMRRHKKDQQTSLGNLLVGCMPYYMKNSHILGKFELYEIVQVPDADKDRVETEYIQRINTHTSVGGLNRSWGQYDMDNAALGGLAMKNTEVIAKWQAAMDKYQMSKVGAV